MVGKRTIIFVKAHYINFYSLWYSFHHISEDLYLGNIEEDYILITELQQLNDRVECQQTRQNNDEKINYYRELLTDWVIFKKRTKRTLFISVKSKEKIIIGHMLIITKNKGVFADIVKLRKITKYLAEPIKRRFHER